MPDFRRGDMWTAYEPADLFLITANSTIRQGGALVLGRGIALQARKRFPSIERVLGKEIRQRFGILGAYYLLVSPRWPAAKLGLFQVKRHYSQPASLELIRRSTAALRDWCANHPDARAHLNFPGTGYGGLSRESVLPLIAQLPSQVTVWEYPSAGKERAS